MGVVVLKYHLRNDVYKHYLYLFCAIRICYTDHYAGYLNVAEEILNEYIEQFSEIYGADTIGSNVHNLFHLVADVRKFGSLSNISSYPFENHLYVIKNLIRHGKSPLHQVANRLVELTSVNKQPKIAKNRSNDKEYIYERGFCLANDNKNKWFLTNTDEIVQMESVVSLESQIYIKGRAIKRIENYFETPFNSSLIDIYCANIELNEPTSFHVSNIKCKMFALYESDRMCVFLPILSTL